MPFKSRETVAYAAGLYEGEGTVVSYFGSFYTRGREKRMRKTPLITLTVGMTDLEPLERFQEGLGVPSTIYGPYVGKPGEKPHWRLTYTGRERVQAVIAMVWPWLSPRRQEQAGRALERMAA